MSRSSVFVCTRVVAASVLTIAWLATADAQQNPVPAPPAAPVQQAPTAPAGPLAPEKADGRTVGMSADLGLALHLKDRYQGLTVRAYDKIDGRDVIVLQGRLSPTVAETLSVDKTSGLLVRRVVRFTTVLGRLSAQIDYSDFRPLAGITLPFAVKVTNWDSVSDEKFTEIKINPGVDPARFAKPAPKAGQ